MGQNPTDSEVNDMINEVDVDGTGVLDFNEFVSFVRRLIRNRGDAENELRETFRRCVSICLLFILRYFCTVYNLPLKNVKD